MTGTSGLVDDGTSQDPTVGLRAVAALEHLLLGVLADPDDVTARVLHDLGVATSTVRAAVAARTAAEARADTETLGRAPHGTTAAQVRERVLASLSPVR